MSTKSSYIEGKVTQIIGPVVDVSFESTQGRFAEHFGCFACCSFGRQLCGIGMSAAHGRG